jgi:hypothetical protein
MGGYVFPARSPAPAIFGGLGLAALGAKVDDAKGPAAGKK